MKPILKTLPRSAAVIPIRPRLDSKASGSLAPLVFHLDELLLAILRRRSIPALRLALGLVFLWFGTLKIVGSSPVIPLIQETFTFLPVHVFVLVLGVWEMLIGIGIILKRALRCVLVLLSVHLVGTFAALLLNPYHFFVQGFPLFLTTDGEFVMKNLVLIAAALVIAGYEVKPLTRPEERSY
jgi:putative oxidoreductase